MNAQALPTGTKRVRPGRRLSLRQVVDLQGFSYDAAKGLSADFQAETDKATRAKMASGIANLAKGWVSLQDAKREILGRPRAGDFKSERRRDERRRRGLQTEPVDPTAPAP